MSRPVYTSLPQIKAKLPHDFVVEALDDDGDGEIDAAVLELVLETAADDVDGRLGQRYAVPFDTDALPAIVSSASLILVLETLYLRRGFGNAETNPFFTSAADTRKKLDKIGNGEGQLTPEAKRPKASVAVYGEPSKTTSGNGNLSC